MKPDFRVVIAGSRTFNDLNLMSEKCDVFLSQKAITHNLIIISGTAGGADRLGEQYAASRGWKVERFPANWSQFGKQAGHIRNRQMLDVADAVTIFWDGMSRGSENMMKITQQSGKPLRVVMFHPS